MSGAVDWTGRALAVLLLGTAAGLPPSAQAQSYTSDDADTIINSFQAAYYARDCAGAYYKRDPSGGVSDFWRYAEMIEMSGQRDGTIRVGPFKFADDIPA